VNHPLISVVIPTYNRAHCISRAIRSALCQTYSHIEVIVVDDGSDDGTEEAVRKNFAANKQLAYVRQDHAGVASARNHGTRIARGQYVALLDSDDAWEPWKLELQAACLTAHPELALVCSDMAAVDARGEVVAPRYLATMYDAYSFFTLDAIFSGKEPLASHGPARGPAGDGTLFYFGQIFSCMIIGNLIHTSTAVIAKEALARIGGFPENMRVGEDYDAYLRICRDHPVGLLDIPSMRYQVGMPDTLTSAPYRLEAALNYFHSIEPFLTHERDRITLSDAMIRTAWARAFRWIGYEYMNTGDFRKARAYFLGSIRRRPLQPAVWCYAASGLLPNSVAGFIRRLYGFRERLLPKGRSKPAIGVNP
jgi:glycosyltransferase involved in cell wall biosynthesis